MNLFTNMRSSYLLCIVCSTVLCIFAFSDEEEWLKFKSSYGKSYQTNEEENYRFNIFKENLKKIKQNNVLFEKNEATYKLGINKFADISEEEFRNDLQSSFDWNLAKRATNEISLREEETDCITTDEPIPDTFDWRDRDAVTSVKDERTFYNGYSWAFAVAGAFETQVFLAIKTLLTLSAQQLIDCVDATNANKTYWGGKLDFVYDYVGDYGILTEDEYPYTETIGDCKQGDQDGIRYGVLVDMTEECDIKQSVGLDGPVTAVIDASRLASYQGGIIDSTLCSNVEEDLNHSVLIIGYGLEEDVGEYWIIKNSWGTDWGEEGYLRIARLKNNTCGIGISPAIPIVLHDAVDDGYKIKTRYGVV